MNVIINHIPKEPRPIPMMSKATVYGTRVPRRKWRQAIPKTKETPKKMTASVGFDEDSSIKSEIVEFELETVALTSVKVNGIGTSIRVAAMEA